MECSRSSMKKQERPRGPTQCIHITGLEMLRDPTLPIEKVWTDNADHKISMRESGRPDTVPLENDAEKNFIAENSDDRSIDLLEVKQWEKRSGTDTKQARANKSEISQVGFHQSKNTIISGISTTSFATQVSSGVDSTSEYSDFAHDSIHLESIKKSTGRKRDRLQRFSSFKVLSNNREQNTQDTQVYGSQVHGCGGPQYDQFSDFANDSIQLMKGTKDPSTVSCNSVVSDQCCSIPGRAA